MKDNTFFQLFQVAIGTRRSLNGIITETEWRDLLELSKEHHLVSILYQSILCIQNNPVPKNTEHGNNYSIPEIILEEWENLYKENKQRNKDLSVVCALLCKDLAHDGLHSCILTGQSNLAYYPEDLRGCRSPGDIDVWCGLMDPEGIDIAVADADGHGAHFEKYHGERGVIEWVLADYRIKDKKMPEVNYHHVDWEYKGIECVVHFKPSWMNCPWLNRRLQRWFKENEQFNLETFEGFNIPTVGFNAVYQLVHIYRHLFNEGIGLRQLLDYYFVLRTLHIEQGELSDRTDKIQQWMNAMGKGVPSNEEVMRTLGHLGMKEFASAVMYVLQKVFSMPSEYQLCPPDAKRGEFLLNEIMLAGNFGKYDERNVISANEGYLKRFVRRQKRFARFLSQYPSEVIWGPYFSIKQRMWRMVHGWR